MRTGRNDKTPPLFSSRLEIAPSRLGNNALAAYGGGRRSGRQILFSPRIRLNSSGSAAGRPRRPRDRPTCRRGRVSVACHCRVRRAAFSICHRSDGVIGPHSGATVDNNNNSSIYYLPTAARSVNRKSRPGTRAFLTAHNVKEYFNGTNARRVVRSGREYQFI